MKKTITLLLTLAMTFSMLVGCGNETPTETTNNSEVTENVTPNVTEDETVENEEPIVDEPIVEEVTTPAPVGTVVDFSSFWYKCTPLDNGNYLYECYNKLTSDSYKFELPNSYEEFDIDLKTNEDETAYEFDFFGKTYGLWFKTFNNENSMQEYDNYITTNNYMDYYENNNIAILYKNNSNESQITLHRREYNFLTNEIISTYIASDFGSLTIEECETFLRTFEKINVDDSSKVQNEFYELTPIINKDFGISSLDTIKNEFICDVVGSFDNIIYATYTGEDHTYTTPTKNITFSIYKEKAEMLDEDKLLILNTLFNDKEVFSYGTETILSEYPTSYNIDKEPFFYYYNEDNSYCVVSLSNDYYGEMVISIDKYNK